MNFSCGRSTFDSDLSPAIQLVVDGGHTVGVFSPMTTVSQALRKSAIWVKSIRPDVPDHCHSLQVAPAI